MSTKKTGLGLGVGLLFADDKQKELYFECDVNQIVPNTHQPRTHFDTETLEELTASIREHGILQPLVVQELGNGNYQLVAGERRLRASLKAGLKTVPVIIKEIKNEDDLLEIALIENIQRKDLNVIEEAEAYNKLIEKFHYTQEEAAQKVGKKRSTITNILRLLQLPDYVKQDLHENKLTEGHARVLLRLVDNPVELQTIRNQILQKNLSVRQTENSIQKKQKHKKTPLISGQEGMASEYCLNIRNQIANCLQTNVRVVQNGTRGKIEIEYYSIDDLERVVQIIVGKKNNRD